MSKSSGNRNRRRGRGLSTYSRLRKAREADFYGEWVNGRCVVPEKTRSWTQAADGARDAEATPAGAV